MVHQMKLYGKSFEKMRSGQKVSELRLNDEKRRCIQVGDTIVFTNSDNDEEKIAAKVTRLTAYPSFKALYDGVRSDYSDWEELPFIEGIYQYYTPEEEQRFGALEIGIEILNRNS